MPELIATGRNPGERWQNTFRDGETVLLGRAPRHGWAVPWDAMISREHAYLTWQDRKLHVRCLETARNPVYFDGNPVREFAINVGGEFRIGATEFRIVDPNAATQVASAGMAGVLEERIYRSDDLRKFEFRDADRRLEALSRLPALISDSRSDEEFATKLVGLLLQAISRANAAAVIQHDSNRVDEHTEPRMMRFELREGEQGRFRPSRRLIKAALDRGESMLHVWTNGEEDARFTAALDLDWAFATPIVNASCEGWCLYVGGRVGRNATPNSEELQGDMRFAELLAQFIGAIRQVRMLVSQQAGLSQFFSPAVMEMLINNQGEEVLRPRETDVTVLFCDLRGFSRKAESAGQDLHGLLDRVSAALGAMTRSIIRHDGVIADFQGDAVLGFWGWPVPPEDGPLPACRAALEIRDAFSQAQFDVSNPLHGFRIGLGIAHGRAIAGRIGTSEQSKVGVFGTVVNLGSRLESMTKQLRVPLVIDDYTARYVRQNLPRSEGRVRRLGRIRPYGVSSPVEVSELLPPSGPHAPLSDEQLAIYESALDALHAGHWGETLSLLDRYTSGDLAKDFLRIFIAQNEYEPPRDWDGVISLAVK